MKKYKDCVMSIQIRSNVNKREVIADSRYEGPVTLETSLVMMTALINRAGLISTEVLSHVRQARKTDAELKKLSETIRRS
jgi:hypothetical protein